MKINKRKNARERGITLIALAITIIIILILAGVTLTTAIGQNGLFQKSKLAVEEYELAQENEESELSELANQLSNFKVNQLEEKKLLKTVTGTEHENIEGEDKLGNPVVIPGGFKFAGEDDDTVEDGIIIEDDEGNQFVWIPVSNIDGDNDETTTDNQNKEDLIKLKDGTEVEITLGRYTFDGTNGNSTLQQAGNNYDSVVSIGNFQETTNHPNGGTPAKDIGGFVDSVKKNHGYYIGRYEASFKSENRPAVKKSTSYRSNRSNAVTGQLWNFIEQGLASTLSKNMYNEEDKEGKYVESDLVNSYAWDTAIVYIQAMGNANYANASKVCYLTNTGETGDEKCHIFDMAGNLCEWTTEYSTYKTTDTNKNPCVFRGGRFDNDARVSNRQGIWVGYYASITGFRPLLYLK